MNTESVNNSPKWSSTTKLVVTLILLALLAVFLVHFRNLLAPLVLAFMLAYLFYPLTRLLDRCTPLSWRLSVTLLYLLLVAGLLALLLWGGLALAQQVNGLLHLLENSLNYLPDILTGWLSQSYVIGPFRFDLTGFDVNALVRQALGLAQGLLGQIGTLVSVIASSALQIFGWTAFVLLVSYFILLESDGLRGRILNLDDIPAYQEDIIRFRRALKRIWNAFFRGQMLIFLFSLLTYVLILTVLGVREAFLLALLAGLARFVPYIGPAIVWTTLGLVAYFQTGKPWGLSDGWYVVLVLGCAILTDQIFDSIISPRIMGRSLRVHPAAVLVAALVGADLFGLLGVVLAAPLLATLRLILGYIFRKLRDLPPWDGVQITETSAPPPAFFKGVWQRVQKYFKSYAGRLKRK